MKIAPSSEAYCEKHNVVLVGEVIENGQCCCAKCGFMKIRKKTGN